MIHAVSRVALAFVFAYHGLVPKLIARDPGEFTILFDAGISPTVALFMVTAAGVLELVLAAVLLVRWKARWPLILILGLMLAATAGAAVYSPQLLTQAFNPVTLNASVAALAVVDLASLRRGRAAPAASPNLPAPPALPASPAPPALPASLAPPASPAPPAPVPKP